MPEDRSTIDLYRAHRRGLIDYASRIVGDPTRAEDLVHDAWILFDALPARQHVHNPGAYLRRMVRNLSLNALRSVGQRRRVVEGELDIAARIVPDTRPLPDEQLIARQRLDRVLAHLASLPDRQRTAIRMHRLEGYKMREIAERLGVSIGLVHALIADGLVQCAQAADQPGRGERCRQR